MTAEENGRLLSNSALFAGIDEKTLAYLGGRAVRRSFEKGRTIFYQSEAGDTMFVVAAGREGVGLLGRQRDGDCDPPAPRSLRGAVGGGRQWTVGLGDRP